MTALAMGMLPIRHLFYLPVCLSFETNHSERQYTFHFLSRDLRVCVMPLHFCGSAGVVVNDPCVLNWDNTALNIFVPVNSGSFAGTSTKSMALPLLPLVKLQPLSIHETRWWQHQHARTCYNINNMVSSRSHFPN